MPLSVSLDGLPQTTVKEQEYETEEDNESEENEKSCKDYSHSKIDYESDLITPDIKDLKIFSKAQDAAFWDDEVKSMMESVKKIHQSLSEGEKIEEIFKLRSEEFIGRKNIKNKDDLKLLIGEIEKMDAILKVKVNEEKEAKLSRIQAEEETRSILSSLPHHKTSGGMKINFEEFMRLLNEVEKNDSDYSFSHKDSEMNEVVISDVKDEEKEKKTSQNQKTNNFKFVERNIQLAKCGRGTLSLTDEEKSRIEKLLSDVEHSNAKRIEESKEVTKEQSELEAYGMDDIVRSTLNQIDEQLEMMAEMRKQEGYQNKISWLNKNELEGVFSEEKEKIKANGGKREEKNDRNRLKKINQLLTSINSISVKEIFPLTEEELESIITESKEAIIHDPNQESAPIEGDQKRISEIVSNAKLLMPKFKYRFDES